MKTMRTPFFEYVNHRSLRFLLVFVVIGFLTGLDFTDAWGCVVFPHFFFLTPCSLLTVVSFAVLFVAYLKRPSNLTHYLLLGELVFFIARLMVFKGGYAVGFGGSPDPLVLIYDAIALGLRILVIRYDLPWRFHPILIVLAIVGLLYVKSVHFSIPPYYFYQEQRAISQGRQVQADLVGAYSGTILAVEDNQAIPGVAAIEISTDSLIIRHASFPLSGRYFFVLESPDFGLLRSDQLARSFYLIDAEGDGLHFEINDDFFERYAFRLRKQRE